MPDHPARGTHAFRVCWKINLQEKPHLGFHGLFKGIQTVHNQQMGLKTDALSRDIPSDAFDQPGQGLPRRIGDSEKDPQRSLDTVEPSSFDVMVRLVGL